jgi:hypothetical protein
VQEGPILRFAILGLLAAVQIGAADPRLGSWTLTSAQSSQTPANELTITSVHGSGVHVVMSGETHIDFTSKWDGHDTAVPNNPAFNQVELRKINKKQVEIKEKKDGVVVATIRDKISNDGNDLTITTVSEGLADKITVWTRGKGPKILNDPFAGVWVEDLSKTRMQQGSALKIEASGKDGVRFSGAYSYTAHFDGKQYNVQNSNNDTVQLALVDAHTVDAIYRRDDQVTQKDRWLVSADGQQMTLTTTGTLETGQRITENLVFHKQ